MTYPQLSFLLFVIFFILVMYSSRSRAPDVREKAARLFADPVLRTILRLQIVSGRRRAVQQKLDDHRRRASEEDAARAAAVGALALLTVAREEARGNDDGSALATVKTKFALSKEKAVIVSELLRDRLLRRGVLVVEGS
jgi:hypothetical protein